MAQLKIWGGSSWLGKPLKLWNGSVWITKPVKQWNGSAWIIIANSNPAVLTFTVTRTYLGSDPCTDPDQYIFDWTVNGNVNNTLHKLVMWTTFSVDVGNEYSKTELSPASTLSYAFTSDVASGAIQRPSYNFELQLKSDSSVIQSGSGVFPQKTSLRCV